MYTKYDFQTKKSLKEAINNGAKIGIFQPGPFGGNVPDNGTVYLEGPHSPKPHKWYAKAIVENGLIVSVK